MPITILPPPLSMRRTIGARQGSQQLVAARTITVTPPVATEPELALWEDGGGALFEDGVEMEWES